MSINESSIINDRCYYMWNWDQGRMQYFQFDNLRLMSRFLLAHDFKKSTRSFLKKETGLEFSAPDTHSPWRNYARIYKSCLLITEENDHPKPTAIANVLAKPGIVTCDEYLHFLIEATTDPSPAFSGWNDITLKQKIRYPLCFSLKYILAKASVCNTFVTPLNEVIGAYIDSGFIGNEDDLKYIDIINQADHYQNIALNYSKNDKFRQARESIKFISQISYLHYIGKDLVLSLSKEDAMEIFHDLNPIGGKRLNDGNKEIERLASLFKDGSEHDFFGYKGTVSSDEIESGFFEGSKSKRTHIVIERNSKLRSYFFETYAVTECDSCKIDTNKVYPWADKILDIHHILPLSSGTRVDSKKGTVLEDLVPICPTCHRAIHKYYDIYLKSNGKKDFDNEWEAKKVYNSAKSGICKR